MPNRLAAVGSSETLLLPVLLILLGSACSSLDSYTSTEGPTVDTTAELAFEVNDVVDPEPLATIAHDPAVLSAGIDFLEQWLVESDSLLDGSTRTLVNPNDGSIGLAAALPDGWSGGDVAAFDDRAAQVIADRDIAIVFDPATLTEIDRLVFGQPVWGICHDGDSFLTSNGSAALTRRERSDDRDVDQVVERIDVVKVRAEGSSSEGSSVRLAASGLNALTCTQDLVFATIWSTNNLLVIERASGLVLQEVNLDHLAPDDGNSDSHLNAVALGVADLDGRQVDALYVTGRRWSAVYALPVDIRP